MVAKDATTPEAAYFIAPDDEIEGWERKMEHAIAENPTIPETERQAIVSARRGQGLFKEASWSLKRAVG